MREPDRTYEIDRDSDALIWTRVGDMMAGVVAQVLGASIEEAREVVNEAAPQASELALSDDDLTMRAWRLRVENVEGTTGIVTWLVNGPFNPMWRWWTVSAIHLRDVEGIEPAEIRVEGATHEVMICSLNPEFSYGPEMLEARGFPPGSIMSPLDLTHQVVGLQDVQAEQLVELMIRYIGSGKISPDSDFRGRWETILDNTAEHLRFGTHPSWN